MKRVVGLLAVILFLTGFLAAVSVDIIDITSDAIRNKNISSAQEQLEEGQFFCGTSSLGECETDSDCKRTGCSSSVCQNKNEEDTVTTCEYKECYNAETYGVNCLCIKNRCAWSRMTDTEIRRVTTARNRINITAKNWECPGECTCSGSTVKCQLIGGREMTVYAGKSGNVIVQVKGDNMSTNVTLYRVDGKVYGVFKGNETRAVRMLPDQVKEKIRERLRRQLADEKISLEEDGTYQYQAKKRARLFLILPVKVAVKAEIDSETGEIISISKPKWWSFLVKEIEEEPVLGGSCGTVTPGENNACCRSRGYDVWNSEAQDCEFNQ